MNPIIEFCLTNMANGSEKAFEILDEDPNLDVIEYGCLSNCGLCYDHLYALVNGEIVTAETAEELVEKIYQYLEENPMF